MNENLTLVKIDELPTRTRKGKYAEVINEFVDSKMKFARLDGVKATAAVAIRKAVSTIPEAENVTVATNGGSVYLVNDK